jgi:hypothetical protein
MGPDVSNGNNLGAATRYGSSTEGRRLDPPSKQRPGTMRSSATDEAAFFSSPLVYLRSYSLTGP